MASTDFIQHFEVPQWLIKRTIGPRLTPKAGKLNARAPRAQLRFIQPKLRLGPKLKSVPAKLKERLTFKGKTVKFVSEILTEMIQNKPRDSEASFGPERGLANELPFSMSSSDRTTEDDAVGGIEEEKHGFEPRNQLPSRHPTRQIGPPSA